MIYIRMIKIYLLDLWVVQTVIFRIFLIIKNGLDSIKGKYRAANILSKAISASLFPPRSTSEKEKTSTLVPQVPEVSKPVLQAPPTKKTSPLSPSSGSANIICHRFKGMGHVMRDCPSSMPTLQQVMVGIRVLAMLKMNIELLLTFMQKKRQLRRMVKPLISKR